jgi:hypothetical protein
LAGAEADERAIGPACQPRVDDSVYLTSCSFLLSSYVFNISNGWTFSGTCRREGSFGILEQVWITSRRVKVSRFRFIRVVTGRDSLISFFSIQAFSSEAFRRLGSHHGSLGCLLRRPRLCQDLHCRFGDVKQQASFPPISCVLFVVVESLDSLFALSHRSFQYHTLCVYLPILLLSDG